MTKLTPDDVTHIRHALEWGVPAYVIAHIYEVHTSVIENLQKGNTFRERNIQETP